MDIRSGGNASLHDPSGLSPRFEPPLVTRDGAPLPWCLPGVPDGGDACGAPMAALFCMANGFVGAAAWDGPANATQPCAAPAGAPTQPCETFASIDCQPERFRPAANLTAMH